MALFRRRPKQKSAKGSTAKGATIPRERSWRSKRSSPAVQGQTGIAAYSAAMARKRASMAAAEKAEQETPVATAPAVDLVEGDAPPDTEVAPTNEGADDPLPAVSPAPTPEEPTAAAPEPAPEEPEPAAAPFPEQASEPERDQREMPPHEEGMVTDAAYVREERDIVTEPSIEAVEQDDAVLLGFYQPVVSDEAEEATPNVFDSAMTNLQAMIDDAAVHPAVFQTLDLLSCGAVSAGAPAVDATASQEKGAGPQEAEVSAVDAAASQEKEDNLKETEAPALDAAAAQEKGEGSQEAARSWFDYLGPLDCFGPAPGASQEKGVGPEEAENPAVDATASQEKETEAPALDAAAAQEKGEGPQEAARSCFDYLGPLDCFGPAPPDATPPADAQDAAENPAVEAGPEMPTSDGEDPKKLLSVNVGCAALEVTAIEYRQEEEERNLAEVEVRQ